MHATTDSWLVTLTRPTNSVTSVNVCQPITASGSVNDPPSKRGSSVLPSQTRKARPGSPAYRPTHHRPRPVKSTNAPSFNNSPKRALRGLTLLFSAATWISPSNVANTKRVAVMKMPETARENLPRRSRCSGRKVRAWRRVVRSKRRTAPSAKPHAR